MEQKKLKKLSLNKEVVTSLTPTEQNKLRGGGTTSFNKCTGNFACCDEFSIPRSCVFTNCAEGNCDGNTHPDVVIDPGISALC